MEWENAARIPQWKQLTERKNAMAARTSQEEGKKNAVLARLALMFAMVVTLVQRGKRGERDLQDLFKALQMIKDGRRFVVTPVEMVHNQNPEALQRVLSQKIDQIGLSVEDAKYLMDRGVRYVGEVYCLFWDSRGKGVAQRKCAIMTFLATLGLPAILDVTACWTPPYWTEPGFGSALVKSVTVALNSTGWSSRWGHFRAGHRREPQLRDVVNSRTRELGMAGVDCLGQYIVRTRSDWGIGRMRRLQQSFSPMAGLHAAALIPPGWAAPVGVRQEWETELVVMGEELRVLQCEHQQLVEQRESLRELREAQRREKAEENAKLSTYLTEMGVPGARMIALLSRTEDLTLSIRVRNGLRQAEITYLFELVNRTREDLRRCDFGRKSLREIEDVLTERDLTLGMSLHEPLFRKILQMREQGKTFEEIIKALKRL